MSDILIRGMKKPSSCDECFNETDCIWFDCSRSYSLCPLHELPAHGALIDRDAIPYKKIMFDDDDFYYGVTQPYIDRMPVIVPASEEVTNDPKP